MRNLSSAAFADTKAHYDLLDGLRGVAALLVIWYHVFEGFAFASGGSIDTLNHGYLAVDFFFMLSGFVIAYAYDDRWNQSLKLDSFFKRRLIRLHPMVVLGAVLGALTFCLKGSVQWDGTPTAFSWVLVAIVCAMLFIPAIPGGNYEVRGNGEMFPLNGPAWSLFFEYIGNLLYAFFIRRLSNRGLTGWTFLLGLCWLGFALTDAAGYGSMGVGWTLDGVNFAGGLIRMLFPFSLGMLLSRNFRPKPLRGAFWICSLSLVLLFAVPYVNGLEPISFNGLYEAFCLMIAFPLIVWMGASGRTTDNQSTRICKFLGDISYPVYIIHYPFMYLFYAWLIEHKLYTLSETWMVATGIFVGCIAFAYLALKLYDEPLRRYLARRFLHHS